MKRYILHSPFNIYRFKTDQWNHVVHKHTYFEVIFIIQGNGDHHINEHTFSYQKGDVFMLGPEDYHHFTVKTPTEFSFIRFNHFFDHDPEVEKKDPWIQISESLTNDASRSFGSIVQSESEKLRLFLLLEALEKEYEHQHQPYYEFVRDNLMRSILAILARNMKSHAHSLTHHHKNTNMDALLAYIKKHIGQPSRLTITHLAEKFHIAPNYIGTFFKKHTGIPLKTFVIEHRLKLTEARLLYSSLSLTEIAFEFGFTDESHFSKQFRKYYGVSPIRFREKNLMAKP